MQFDNIKYIECFGVSGSGKTHIRKEIKKKLKKKGIKILDRREIIIYEHESIIKLDFIERQVVNYFKLLNFIKKKKRKTSIKKASSEKSTHIKTNLKKILNNVTIKLANKYENICKKILLKNIKSKNIYKFILKILKNSKDINKNLYHFWFVEMLAANSIYEVNKKNLDFIYFPDEGFIQRIFLINQLTEPKNDDIIKEYFRIIPKGELIFNINSKKEKIYHAHSIRKSNNSDFLMNKKEINKMIEFKKKLINNFTNFKFKTIKN
ncbi:hypothetical protein N9586_02330 [Candidatus Pelagibacter sp.]|nr:hypothetical protein [Candidatus Pelagibacter sp.]